MRDDEASSESEESTESEESEESEDSMSDQEGTTTAMLGARGALRDEAEADSMSSESEESVASEDSVESAASVAIAASADEGGARRLEGVLQN